MSIEVVATREGHFVKIRKPGDTFVIDNKKQLSKRWMLDLATPEGAAYRDGIKGDPKAQVNINKRDKLTGERLAAGGVAEQLAVTLDENRELRAQVAELQAAVHVLEGRVVDTPTTDVHAVTEDAADDKVAEPANRVRRRGKPAKVVETTEAPQGDEPTED